MSEIASERLVVNERERRNDLWQMLLARFDPAAVSAPALAELGIRPLNTVQGIYRDMHRTATLGRSEGVTLSILHTGRHYADEFDDECGLYRYPSTSRSGRDSAEIEATKNARRFQLPIFVLLRTGGSSAGVVRRGWISDWDDVGRTFLIAFDEKSEEPRDVDAPFSLRVPRASRSATSPTRTGQPKFRFCVFKRYGLHCAVCTVAIPDLLEAVHLCGFASGGTDDPRNGLVLCRNHHIAFDAGLFGIDPNGAAVRLKRDGPSATALGLTRADLTHLPALPHGEALAWCWKTFAAAKCD